MLRLNLGCGTDIRQGFVNIDFRKLPGVNRVFDISSNEKMYPDNSVDYILAQDILEHFPQAEVMRILKGFADMLKKGGILEVQTPDIIEVVIKSLGDDWAIRRIYGGQEYPENFHKSGFTRATMRRSLTKVGLEIIKEGDGGLGNLMFKAQK